MNAVIRSLFFGAVMGLALSFSNPAIAQDDTSAVEMKAVEVADKWLAVVDGGEYDKSWMESASFFKEAISKEDWTTVITEARGPMGNLTGRELLGKKFLTSLPNAPEGEYVVIQYKAVFDGTDKPFIETVTPMKDTDGTWRISGYYIYEMPQQAQAK